MVKIWARHNTTEALLDNGWRSVAAAVVGGWRLVAVDGWRLVAVDGWRLVVPGGCPEGPSLKKKF